MQISLKKIISICLCALLRNFFVRGVDFKCVSMEKQFGGESK